jgi:hypothetical protein
MSTNGTIAKAGVVVVVGTLAAVLGACTPPTGSTGGRVDPTRTTRAEAGSAQVLPASLFEFSDKVAQQLAADMKQVPALNGEFRQTVVFGNLVNKTGVVPTSDFEAFRTRVRGSLMQSQNVLKNVRFVENKANVDANIRRETGRSADLLGEGRRNERAELDPANTYFLDGEMYRVDRGQASVNLYMLSYTLTNMASGEIIWQNAPYEVKQVR